jgi:hypothetical protein
MEVESRSVVMCDTLPLLRQQPRNEDIRAEDDHEAAGDDAGVGEIGYDPAANKE